MTTALPAFAMTSAMPAAIVPVPTMPMEAIARAGVMAAEALGDLWDQVHGARHQGPPTPDDVQKLLARYPEGFSEEASKNRSDR